jgi:putative intracellular protease/amidase
MFDLATDKIAHKLVNEFYDNKKIIAAVCHGPAALVNVRLSSGLSLLDGQRVTGISNSEEEIEQVTSFMPFKLENELNRLSGGKYEKGNEWEENVVVARGGLLITGQNPASAAGVGKAIYEAIFGELKSKGDL